MLEHHANLAAAQLAQRFLVRGRDVVALEVRPCPPSARSAGSGSAPAWTCPSRTGPSRRTPRRTADVEADVAHGGRAPGLLLDVLELSARPGSRRTRSRSLGAEDLPQSIDTELASLRPGLGGATTAVGALSVWMATRISSLVGLSVNRRAAGRGLSPEPPLGSRVDVLPDVLGLAVLVETGPVRARGRCRTA